MLRLRTTTALSLLALALGAGGTHWLSGQGADWPGRRVWPPAAAAHLVAAAQPQAPRVHSRQATRHPWHGPVRVVGTHRTAATIASGTPATPELVPLDMPVAAALPWSQQRGHLNGRVVLQLDIDARGHVQRARVASSSGDPQLDARALRSVRGWTFRVPADYPAGFSGTLPMRFTSRDERLARS